MRALPLVFLLTSSPAWAWPGDAAWIPFSQSGTPVVDVAQDQDSSDEGLDLVGQASPDEPVAFWYADADALYLRMRVNEDPEHGSVPHAFNTGAWGFQLETDGNTDNYEFTIGMTGLGGSLAVYRNTDGGTGSDEVAEDVVAFWTTPLASGEARVSVADSSMDSDADWFVDFEVSRMTLEDDLGLLADSGFQVLIATGETNDLGQLGADMAGHDDSSGYGDLSDGWTDAITIDTDGDGLTDPEEAAIETDPEDADTDDDGLGDGEEWWDLGTDPLACDSDLDGLMDGLEAGADTPLDDTDTSVGCFVADVDPASTTDPNESDTDAGTLPDGDEDRNGNGRIDDWETDPNDPADDVDADGDGIPDSIEEQCGGSDTTDRDGDGITDADEGLTDSDGDGVPDFCDEDDDGDGIDTIEEGNQDTDEDGTPDHLDDDSDDDGISDEEEGTGDVDCDGIPDFQDADDTDGPCADPDEDGLTNAEEEECGTDPHNPDTDGDGILDGDESCEDDTDGDGVVDALDGEDGTGDGTGPGTPADGEQGTFGFGEGHFTGGSCSAVGAPAAGWAGLLALFGAATRRRKRTRPGLTALVAGTLPATAAAQDIDAQRFRPSIDGAALMVVDDAGIGPDGPGGSLVINHADDPFVYRYDDPGREEVPILGSVTTANLLAYFSWKPVRVGIDLPLHLGADGFFPTDTPKTMGDISVEGKVALLDRWEDPLGLALLARVGFPTGNGDAWLGDPSATLGGGVSASYGTERFVSFNLGFEGGRSTVLDDVSWGNRLQWGVGGYTPVVGPVGASLELSGDALLGSSGAPGALPMEGLVGLRVRPWESLLIGAGGGVGMTQGIGAPDSRLVASVGWVPERKRPQSKVAAASLGPDRDGDGIPDDADLCPDQAEDRNGTADHDGCPDAGLVPTTVTVQSAQGAAVAGVQLELTNGPETGKYQLGDGTLTRSIPPGTYGVRVAADGFLETRTSFTVEASPQHAVAITMPEDAGTGQVRLRVSDAEGNPIAASARVPGSDIAIDCSGDGIGQGTLPAGHHELVISAEGHGVVVRSVEVSRGSDARLDVVLRGARVRLAADRIHILDRVYFELNSAILKKESFAILDEVFVALLDHPELQQVEIQGHTDAQGSEQYNQELSQKRAEAVQRYLVTRGISGARLLASGYGESQLLQQGVSDEVHGLNRRVEFHVLDRAD